jgi:hypothetical protein
MRCEHSPGPQATASSADTRRGDACRCDAVIYSGRRAAPVSRCEPYAFCRVFPGHDRVRLPAFPGGASAGGHGMGQGCPAGGGFSILGREPVVAQSAAGVLVQRCGDRALCPGCISGDREPVAGIEGQLFCRERGTSRVPVRWKLRLRPLRLTRVVDLRG